MSKLYLFNMQAGDRSTDRTSFYLNAASTAQSVRTTNVANDFIPFSTSYAISSRTPPDGAFGPINRLRVENDGAGVHQRFDAVPAPSDMGDLILYALPAAILLFDQKGLLQAQLGPAPGARGEIAAQPFTGTEPGQVYLFNLSPLAVQFSSNGGLIGALEGWASGGASEQPYTPLVTPVARVLNISGGAGRIANGRNRMLLQSIEGARAFVFDIDGIRFPLNQSFWLFLARSAWWLTDGAGTAIAQGQMSLEKSK